MRWLLMLLDGTANRFGSDLAVLREIQPQGLVDSLLTVVRRQLQDLEVFANRDAPRVIAAERIVGHPKVARGKHVFLVLVVLKRPRLTNQRIDHVAIVDGMLTAAR